MYRFIEALRIERDEDFNSFLERDLIKYREFIKYSYSKLHKYDLAIKNILDDIEQQFETVNLNSDKDCDKIKIKKLKRKCEDTLFWFTKTKELTATICNYANMSKYEEQDVIEFKNATQILRVVDFNNLNSEYVVGEPIEGVEVEVVNLGYDTNRTLKIVYSIKNADLGIDISSETNVSIQIERAKTASIPLPNIDSPNQQCRAYLVVDIYNQDDEIVSGQNMKEIFFRRGKHS